MPRSKRETCFCSVCDWLGYRAAQDGVFMDKPCPKCGAEVHRRPVAPTPFKKNRK